MSKYDNAQHGGNCQCQCVTVFFISNAIFSVILIIINICDVLDIKIKILFINS